MPSSSRRQSIAPYLPGAWPSSLSSRDHHDDADDADISSVSSYGSLVANVRARKQSGRRARRRWTYAGPSPPHAHSNTLASFVCPSMGPLSANTSNELKMSPLTDATVSTAMSSPLNTPELADWPTRLGAYHGSDSLLLNNITPPNTSPTSVTRYGKLFTPPQGASGSAHHPQLPSSASRDHLFPYTHLDRPLLNFIPGPPSKVPPPDFPADYLYSESPSAPSSLAPDARPTPHSFTIPPPGPNLTLSHSTSCAGFAPPGVTTLIYPTAELSEPFLRPTSSDLSVPQTSDGDSPILPSADATHTGIAQAAALDRSSSPVPQMDAFALAAAVALSNSRSSFSIPQSLQSVSPPPATVCNLTAFELPRPCAYKRPSDATVSTGHRSREDGYLHENSIATGQDVLVVGDIERSRARRLSAPHPVVWQNPRPPLVPTVSSRVDVGEDGVSRRRPEKQPVIGKVRKFGERIRGLFKSKGDTSTKRDRGHTTANPEISLMTTTTAVTNVEYELEFPEPLPSPRTKHLRNHRRSLPLPLLLSSSMDQSPSTVFNHTLPRCGNASLLSSPSNDLAVVNNSGHPSHNILAANDPCRTPRTPKARRERTCTAPQTNESDRKTANERKARRFSLSSKIDSLRATVRPRPPIPGFAARIRDDLRTGPAGEASGPAAGSSASGQGRSPEQEGFWGGELPGIQDTGDTEARRSPVPDSPTRSRTQTAPSYSSIPPQHEASSSTPKDKRSRRFSLSSVIAKRAARSSGPADGLGTERSSPSSIKKTRKPSRHRPRGDTVTTITHGSVRFDMVSPRPGLDMPLRPPVDVPLPRRSSLVPSMASSGGETTYYDAEEEFSDGGRSFKLFVPDRCCSPAPESDLDSMSFARTPDYSSGTFSFGSSTERELGHGTCDPSWSSSHVYPRRPSSVGRFTSTNAVSHLVGESTSTPITKTLRFSPSLSLSFDMSCSDADFGDEDEMGRLEREEDLSFMRTLGFEFDEIARRVREGTL